MGLLSTEHGRKSQLADIALYAAASASLATILTVVAPFGRRSEILALAMLGLAAWTLVEYLLHRFVLHGMAPFKDWHAEHHQRPRALIGTPTVLSAALIASLVFLPALLLSDLWRALALTFGLLTGYLVYAIVHHATHHWRAEYAWTRMLKRHHALHHGKAGMPSRYGVTSPLWDIVFRTEGPPVAGAARKAESGVDAARDAAGMAAWENEGGASAVTEAGDRHVPVR